MAGQKQSDDRVFQSRENRQVTNPFTPIVISSIYAFSNEQTNNNALHRSSLKSEEREVMKDGKKLLLVLDLLFLLIQLITSDHAAV